MHERGTTAHPGCDISGLLIGITGTCETPAEQLATWMETVMPHHQITVSGIPAFNYTNLETPLQ
jgi:hypothetical protein